MYINFISYKIIIFIQIFYRVLLLLFGMTYQYNITIVQKLIITYLRNLYIKNIQGYKQWFLMVAQFGLCFHQKLSSFPNFTGRFISCFTKLWIAKSVPSCIHLVFVFITKFHVQWRQNVDLIHCMHLFLFSSKT